MAEAGPNLPGEAQFEEFEEEEVGAGAEQAEEGAARSAVPEVPHYVEPQAHHHQPLLLS